MLSSIRNHAKGWLGLTLLALIAIPFAFTGVYSYVSGGGSVVVAEVDDREIGQREYANAYQSYRQQLQNVLGSNFRPELFDEKALRREALERLIEEIVLVDAAREQGYQVGANQLAQRITTTPAFQTDGRFDRDLYQTRLAQTGLTPEQYEQNLRAQLLMEQLLGSIGSTAFVTPGELDEVQRLQLQRRSVAYALIPPTRLEELPPPDADALAAFYAASGAAFAEPEQVQVDYLELSVERLMSAVDEPDQATLERLYEEERSRLATSEERRVRHLLLELPSEADAATEAATLERAQALRAQLAEGVDFAELARTESADPGSAAAGGDLGFIARGQMEPAFEEAAFALAVDEISAPVRTGFGYHLIQVTEIRGGQPQELASMRGTLTELYRRQQAEQIFFDRSETLANLAYEHPDSLEPAAEALGLQVQRSPWLTRDGGDDWLLAEPQVLDAAFAPEVLGEGLNSEVLELADGRLLVLRLGQRKPARQPELEEVRAAVVARYQEQRARELARERGRELLARLRAGATLEDVAAEAGLETVEVSGMTRDDTARPLPLVRAAFRLPRPVAAGPSVTGVELDDGGYALLQLRAVEAGTPETAADEARLREALARVQGTSELAGVVSGVRQRATVVINEENL
jgi:peptidyl-prolyl cis-trans isomerase D